MRNPDRLQLDVNSTSLNTPVPSFLGLTSANTANKQCSFMRVGINCLDVNPSFVGGVTTYVQGLLEGFANVGSNCQFRIFVTRGNRHLFEKLRTRDNCEIIILKDPFLSFRNLLCRSSLLSLSSKVYKIASDFIFEEIRGLIDAQSDILYTPTPVLKYYNSCIPTVLSMHDIQHLHHPEFFSWPRRVSRRIAYGLSARHAFYIQASSQYIKHDLLDHFPWLTPEQIEVIPSGALIETFAKPVSGESVSLRYELPERFLFFPAQLWPHKNHITVLKALKRMEVEHGLSVPLVLTGGEFSAAPEIFKFVADHSMHYVRYVGKVSPDDMIALYQKSTFMITATLHESSSLPILEAAAAGTPVIASKIPPIEELGRKLQLNLFNPLDVDELVRLISVLWRDGQKGAAQAAYNRQQVCFYSWDNTARNYLHLFRRILEGDCRSTPLPKNG